MWSMSSAYITFMLPPICSVSVLAMDRPSPVDLFAVLTV